jgi:hypothetical protein
MKNYILLIALSFTLYTCKKDTKNSEPTNNPPADVTGSLKVSFANTVDGAPLVYGQNYVNLNNDTFKVDKFHYYISNVKLTKSDNSVYSVPESYFLINYGSLDNNFFNLAGIPSGTYKSISYIIGVDSTKNVSGAQERDLSPSKGMFWNWFTGYIMLKLEGTSPQAGSMDKSIVYHIGGFAQPNSAIREVTISFTKDLVISSSKNPHLKLVTNVNELFKNPVKMEMANDYFIMAVGLRSNTFADNYKDMTTFEDIIP